MLLDNSQDVAAEASFLAKVEVQRYDPSSPLHSVNLFEELPL